MKTIREVIGEQVCRYRKRNGWSQAEFGRRLEPFTRHAWSRPAVSKAENGGRAFDIDDLVAITRALGGMSILQLLATDEARVQLTSGKIVASAAIVGALLPNSAETPLAAMTTAGARNALVAQKAALEDAERTLRRVGERVAEGLRAIHSAEEYRRYLAAPWEVATPSRRRRSTHG